jgi:hypothetical protein
MFRQVFAAVGLFKKSMRNLKMLLCPTADLDNLLRDSLVDSISN